uniref:Uncharacterized protein n=1 Tax=Arion vulgaris TaxID=1028688 RepID=A0A0B7AXK6_9EUPU
MVAKPASLSAFSLSSTSHVFRNKDSCKLLSSVYVQNPADLSNKPLPKSVQHLHHLISFFHTLNKKSVGDFRTEKLLLLLSLELPKVLHRHIDNNVLNLV